MPIVRLKVTAYPKNWFKQKRRLPVCLPHLEIRVRNDLRLWLTIWSSPSFATTKRGRSDQG